MIEGNMTINCSTKETAECQEICVFQVEQTTELLLIEICCLSVALIVSRNTSRLNLNRKL